MTTGMGLAPGDGEDNVAGHVRLEREARGWSTAELARRVTEAGCPMSQSAVWRIESGEPRRKISVDELIAFSRVFGKPIEALLRPPRPDYPRELLRAYLIQWMDQEQQAWHQKVQARVAISDIGEMLRMFPGAAAHLPQLVEEILEASHRGYLREDMLKMLQSNVPQLLAEGSQQPPSFAEPAGVVAYWNFLGLTKEEMLEKADEWGVRSVFQPIIERGAVNSHAMLGGRLAPLNRVTLDEQGRVTLVKPEARQHPPSAMKAGVSKHRTKQEQEDAEQAAARRLS